jgi:glycosyltransferase involved in cell wall biosynthesis
MRILIYVGYQKQPFNSSTISEMGLGGTEHACTNLAKELAKLGHSVQVGGHVLNEIKDGIIWNDNLRNQHFDIVIAASYIHYMLELEDRGVTYDKSFFWMHNEQFFPWWKGQQIENVDQQLDRKELSAVICLTEWHKQDFIKRYNFKGTVHIIGNGIDPRTFIKREKNKNTFIYSSAHERGLERVLEMWPKIKSFWPTAELRVFSPSYSDQIYGKVNGVKFFGSVDQLTLHKHMAESQYWLYPTQYKETYCITALEMQMAGVIPICSDLAALKETVDSRGFTVNHETTSLQPYINIVANLKNSQDLVKTYSDKAHNWAKCQTWRMRALEWHKLISL